METGKNRSSILKPQKPRNPLSDLDLVEHVEVDSPVKAARRSSLRRVSFASSNFVKEFATDPEKNTTVWDTTYEEMLNKSDSNHSSETTHNLFDMHSKKQPVLEVQHITSDIKHTKVSQDSNQLCVTTCSEVAEKIGLMKPDVCTENENRKASINFYEHGGEDILSDSSLCGIDTCETRIIETVSFQSSNDIKNVKTNIINVARQTDNMTQQIIQKEQFQTRNVDVKVKGTPDSKNLPQVSPCNAHNMPFTNLFSQTQNFTATDKENIPTQSGSRVSRPTLNHRKLCQPIAMADAHCGSLLSKMKPVVIKKESVQQLFGSTKNICCIKNETVVSSNTMELTQQFSGFNRNISENRAIELSNMEFTQNLQSVNKSECSVKSSSVIADENMEIAQQFPNFDKSSFNTRVKTIMMDKNLKCTQQFPDLNILARSENGSNEQVVRDDKNRTVVTDEKMKITQQFPVIDNSSCNLRNITNITDESMEFTQQLPAINLLALNTNNINESLAKGDESRTIIADENMEFTQQLPAINLLALNTNNINETLVKGDENRTIIADENMEISQQFPIVDSSSYNTGNKTIMVEENLEFTQQLPDLHFPTLNVNGSNKSVVKDDNVNKECNGISLVKTMDFTEQLHNTNLENNEVSKMSIVIDNDDIKKESIVASPIAVSEKNVEPIQSLVEGIWIENNVLKNSLTAATEKVSSFNDENNVSLNKLTISNSGELTSVNHSFYISRHAENGNQNDEDKGNSIDITCSTPMDVDSVTPVLIDLNAEGVNNTYMNVASIPISHLKCENEKSTCYSSAVNTCINKAVMTELPLETCKNNVVSDVPENKEKFLLQLEDKNGTNTCCSSANNYGYLNNTNQELIMDNQNVKKVNTGLASDDWKNINVSNGAFQQFNAVHNSFSTLSVNQNQNLFADEKTSNDTKLVQENINQTEIKVQVQDEETKEASKEMSMSKQNINCSDFKTPESSFHTTFTPFSPGIDDTQHLINYSLTHKQPKSDFSKIIMGDLNPSFLSSKFMPLSEFSNDAFPVSLETSRYNQTNMELDKVKDWDVFPVTVATDHSSGIQFENEELGKDENSALQVSGETINANQINLEPIELKKDEICDTFPVSLQTVDNNQTHHEQMELGNDKNYEKRNKDKRSLLMTWDSNETNTEVSNKEQINNLKHRSSENVETVVFCKKPMLDNTEENAVGMINMDEKMETSITETINISQENITLSDSVASSVSDIYTKEAKELVFNLTQSINVNPSMNMSTHQLQETYVKRTFLNQRFADFMENTRKCAAAAAKNLVVLGELYDEEAKEICKPFKQHSFQDFKTNADFSAECSLAEPLCENIVVEERALFHIDSNPTIDMEKVLTLQEKLEEKRKRCKGYWNVLSIEDDKCEFDTLYKTIRLIVQLNKETGIVNKTDICCNILDDSDPTALFVHKIFKDRLSQKNIQSAVGEKYDILTLLDYVHMNMQQMLEALNEFDSFAKRFNLKMDQNFSVTFKIVNLHLRSTWCISVDTSDIQNITEDSVSAYAKVGTVNETEIKRFVVGCPHGILFLRHFISNILGYIELLMKRKNLIKSKAME